MMTAVSTPAPVRFFLERFGLDRAPARGDRRRRHRPPAPTTRTCTSSSAPPRASPRGGHRQEAPKNVSQGVGVRVVAGDKTGCAHTDDVTVDSLQLATRTAQAIAEAGGDTRAGGGARDPPGARPLRAAALAAGRSGLDEKIDAAQPHRHRGAPPRSAHHERPGQPRRRAEDRPDRQLGRRRRRRRAAAGAPERHLHRRRERQAPAGHVRRRRPGRVHASSSKTTATCASRAAAADQALRNLHAVDAPAGTMTVVLGPGWPGVLLHEAVGHGLEGDFNRKKVSAFSGRMGERVASPLCTVVDDGTIANRRGSLNCRRRGHADRPHGADRERHPARLPAGPPQRPPHGHAADRQRPARELRAHADAAHDQHLHAGRRLDARGDHPLGRSRASTPRPSAAARWTSPAASSSSPPPRPT